MTNNNFISDVAKESDAVISILINRNTLIIGNDFDVVIGGGDIGGLRGKNQGGGNK